MNTNLLLQLFVLSGTCNVLLLKALNILQGECSDGKWRTFQHPVVQTGLMFIGEILCLVFYKITFFLLKRRVDGSENTNFITRGEREFSLRILIFPALCDVVAAMMLLTALFLTYTSSFQMLRGICIIFVGIFSSMYLNQTLGSRHWWSMLTISCGAIILVTIDIQRVYYDNASLSKADVNSILTGDLLIVCAQIFNAAQFVYEEKYVKGLDIPALQAIGWQGIYGLIITVVLAVALHFTPVAGPFGNNSHGVFDDLTDVVPQLVSNSWLILIISMFIISTTCYNFTALSITKFSSATNRLLADTLRLVFIWLGVLLLEWELMNMGVLMASFIIIMGTIAYRNAVFVEWYRSLLASLVRRRYVDINVDTGSNVNSVAVSQPADII